MPGDRVVLFMGPESGGSEEWPDQVKDQTGEASQSEFNSPKIHGLIWAELARVRGALCSNFPYGYW